VGKQAKKGKGFNVATVALANKLARIAWALLIHQTNYRAALETD